jgi:fructose-1,6-bisphosphatase
MRANETILQDVAHAETASMEYLRREVSQETGKEETLAAVKRALQEARTKVREYLRRKGLPQIYGVADERDE